MAEDEWLAGAEPVGVDAEPDGTLEGEIDAVVSGSLDESLQSLLTVSPGAWTLGLRVLLAQLASPGHGGRRLSPGQRIDYLTALARQAAHAGAVQARLLAEIERADISAYADRHGRPVPGFAREEVACVLR